MPDFKPIIVTLAVGFVLTVVFWSGLWLGGGLIGGDLYSYFFPQKTFYAEALAAGRLPLWNDRVGYGYPTLGESQTGVLYPTNLILYRLFNVNTAYNLSQLGHYLATFAAAVWFLRGRGIGIAAALFGAGVYTYGWFPPRICLEWAILGGPYLPLGLGLIDRYFASRRNRYLALLTIALATHLLAGHFNLAFIECAVWTLYAAGRTLAQRRESDSDQPGTINRQLSQAAPIVVSILAGFALVSYPLADTYALKKESQREGQTEVFTPAQGHIPPIYLSQTVASWWYWYSQSIDTDSAIKRLPAIASGDTNKVEAHLYFGLIPLALAAMGLWQSVRSRSSESIDRGDLLIAAIGVFAVIYATGALLPITRHLPGFGYFIGPGRWGIVATLSVALFASRAIDGLLATVDARRATLVLATLSVLTLADLYVVSRRVTYAFVTPVPPINFIDRSPVKQFFDGEPQAQEPPRVYGPGANVLTLLGVSQWPTYLGLGPAAYWEAMPAAPEGVDAPMYSDEQRDWLAANAVSHVLTFQPVDHARWRLERAANIVDPVLNAIWGRGPDEPVFIYRIPDAVDRIRFEPSIDGTIEILKRVPGEVIFEADVLKRLRNGRVVVEPLPVTGWQEDDFERLIPDGPIRLAANGLSAEQPGENVGAFWLKYHPAGSRSPGLFIVTALTLAGMIWLAYLFITRGEKATKP